MTDAPVPGGGAPVVVTGPDLLYNVPVLNGGTVSNAGTITVPGTIAASGTFVSTVIPTFGMTHLAAAAKLDQAGTLSIQRYLDNAGSVASGAAVTAVLTAGTVNTIDNVTTAITQSMKLSIVNAATAVAVPSSVLVVQKP